MKVLVISDTHGRHRELVGLPDADVLVHCGDVTEGGTEEEGMDFLEWFVGLEYEHKIFVAGNHDFCFHGGAQVEGLPGNCHFLNYESVVIEGVKFHGVPYSVADEISGRYGEGIAAIPVDTEVLISHDAPCGILDLSDGIHYGSLPLLRRVEYVRPAFHLFGHVHASAGMVKYGRTTFVNAAVCSKGRLGNRYSVLSL